MKSSPPKCKTDLFNFTMPWRDFAILCRYQGKATDLCLDFSIEHIIFGEKECA